MKLLNAAVALLCMAGFPAFASNSAVTATAKDTDSQTWNNGTFTATLTLPGSVFRADVPKVNGVPVPAIIKGVLSSSGVLTGTFTDTSTVDQAGARWVFVVCPNTSGPQCATVSTTVIGATPNLSPAFMQLPAPRFPAGVTSYGYADTEVLLPPPNGSSYYNVTLQAFRQWNGVVWTGSGGAGGAVSSVFTRIGDITAHADDYSADQITNAADKASTSQQTFLGAIKVPAFLLGSRIGVSLTGDSQAILTTADNGQIPIPPGHLLQLLTDTSGGGSGAGDSGIDGANVITSLTTTGTSGPATVSGRVLNIPQYSGGGGGSMTWPAGGAGIPNYNGSSAWGTSYSASNQIPSTFIPTLNQSTTGNAGTATLAANLSGTQIGNSFYASPNGTSGVGLWRRIVAGDIPTLAYIASSAAPTGAIVGTTDTQTLTNKTVDGVAPATMAFVDPTSSIQTQLNGKAPVGAANVTTTVGVITLAANSSSSSAITVSMPGVTTGMTFEFTATADATGITGWGNSGGLMIQAWPTANQLNYKVVNQTASSITTGASITFNVSAK